MGLVHGRPTNTDTAPFYIRADRHQRVYQRALAQITNVRTCRRACFNGRGAPTGAPSRKTRLSRLSHTISRDKHARSYVFICVYICACMQRRRRRHLVFHRCSWITLSRKYILITSLSPVCPEKARVSSWERTYERKSRWRRPTFLSHRARAHGDRGKVSIDGYTSVVSRSGKRARAI